MKSLPDHTPGDLEENEAETGEPPESRVTAVPLLHAIQHWAPLWSGVIAALALLLELIRMVIQD